MKEFKIEDDNYVAVELYSDVTGDFWVEPDKKDMILFFVRPLPPFGNVRRMKRLYGMGDAKLQIIGTIRQIESDKTKFYPTNGIRKVYDLNGNHLLIKIINNENKPHEQQKDTN